MTLPRPFFDGPDLEDFLARLDDELDEHDHLLSLQDRSDDMTPTSAFARVSLQLVAPVAALGTDAVPPHRDRGTRTTFDGRDAA
jgi:hypothetical protein